MLISISSYFAVVEDEKMWEIFSGLIPVLEVSQGDDRVTRHTLYNLASMHLLYCLSLIFESQDDTVAKSLAKVLFAAQFRRRPNTPSKFLTLPLVSNRGIKPGSLWLTVNHPNH